MFAIIENAGGKVVHLLGEEPVITENGMTSPIRAFDIKSDTHTVEEVDQPPFVFIPGLVTLSEGEWAIADEYAHGKAMEPTRDQINAERDRRFGLGFYFGGVLFQSDRDSRENVAGAGTMALGAMMAGKQPGDLKWARPDRDFTWTAADNSQVPMDAPTTFTFAASLGLRKEAFIKAAQEIKAMDPMPADFATNDAYWPPLEP